MKQSLSYCGDLVKRHDRDRFLLSLCASPEKREALWTLFAFNHEIARTREVVSETQLGLIRLQWWREAIAGIYEARVTHHEIVEALAGIIKAHDLPRRDFEDLITAREMDMQAEPFTTFPQLEIYADRTSTPLNRLALRILGQEEEERAIRAVSIAYALTGLARAVPFHEAQGRRLLPRGREDIGAVVKLADKYRDSVKPQGRFLRAMAALSEEYSNKIKSLSFNVADPRINRPPLKFLVKLVLRRI